MDGRRRDGHRRGAALLGALVLLVAGTHAQEEEPYDLYLRLHQHRGAGELAEALALADEGLARVEPDDPLFPYFALARADALVQTGRYEDGQAALDGAPGAFDAGSPLRATALRVRAEAFLGAGDVARAAVPIGTLEELSQAARAQGDASLVHTWRLLDVKLHLARADPAGATEAINAYLADEASYAGRDGDRGVMLANLGLAQLQLEFEDPTRPAAAASTLDEALALPLADDLRPLVAAARAGLAVDAGDLAQAQRVLADLAPAGERARMLVATERARLHLAQRAERAVLDTDRGALRALLSELLASWDALPVRPDGTGFLQYRERRALMAALVALHVATDGAERGAERAADDLFRAQARASLARRLAAPEPSLEEVRRRLLGPGRGLLVYLPVARGTHVLAIDAERVVHAELAGVHALDRVRREWLQSIREGGAASGARREALARRERELAREMGRLLVPDGIAAQLQDWNAVSFTGLDALGIVPVAWLRVGDRTLGLTHAVDSVPSVPWAAQRAQTAGAPLAPDPARAEFLLVGDIAPGEAVRARFEHLVPAVLSGHQRSALLAPYSHGATASLLGPDATLPGLAARDLGDLSVLQVIAHGVRLDDRPRPAALVLGAALGDDGLLGCAEVEGLTRAPRLVVLTSCRSGQAPPRLGDANSADLGGAWLASGAEAVVLAQSDLVLGPAVELTARFHAELRGGGVSPAEALRRARASLAAEEGIEGLALRYGVLQVVGLGQLPVFAARPEQGPGILPWLGAGAALLLGALVLRLLRSRRA